MAAKKSMNNGSKEETEPVDQGTDQEAEVVLVDSDEVEVTLEGLSDGTAIANELDIANDTGNSTGPHLRIQKDGGKMVTDEEYSKAIFVGEAGPELAFKPEGGAIVSAAAVVKAAQTDRRRAEGRGTPGSEESVGIVQEALMAEGLLEFCSEGCFDGNTHKAFEAWKHVASTDDDTKALRALGTAQGFEVLK